MKPPKQFGECLDILMQRYRLSISMLGTLLGNRAELKSALRGTLSPAKQLGLYQRLMALNVFSQEDYGRLSKAHEVSRLGVQQYLAQAAILRLLDNPVSQTAFDLEESNDLENNLAQIAEASDIRILCVNSCYPSLFRTLAPLFADPDRQITMRHFVRLTRIGCDAASLVYSASPILSDQRYQPYSVSDDADMHCFSGDFSIIRFQKRGKWKEFYFIMQSNARIFPLPLASNSTAYDIALDIAKTFDPLPKPLKELGQPGKTYLDMMVRFLFLELNHTSYSINADFGHLQVPPQVVDKALDTECVAELGITSDADREQLRSLLERRYRNYFSKKKPNYQITTYEGIRQFLETGKTQHHFTGFRTLTPQERLETVGAMLSYARNSSTYHLQLLNTPNSAAQYTIVGFDGIGVSIVPVEASYHAGHGFSYIYLDNAVFTQQFSICFLKHITKELCYDEQTSLQLLTELYSQYERRFSQG